MKTREKVYRYIRQYKQEHDGVAPSVREIAQHIGGKSTSVVHYHLEMLQAQGKIQLLKQGTGARGGSRCIAVIGGQWMPPEDDHATGKTGQ
jgi:SOS-response transcriptional repressor LexA